MRSGKYWIDKLKLKEHPEGGFFREVYRSAGIIEKGALPEKYSASRSYSTAIYFLLEKGNPSRFHRLKSDEMWHFYEGDLLQLYIIDEKGGLDIVRLGRDLENGELFTVVVKAGCWFGAEVADGGAYSLMGCTAVPGFEFEDFELGERDKLIRLYPEHKNIIEGLT